VGESGKEATGATYHAVSAVAACHRGTAAGSSQPVVRLAQHDRHDRDRVRSRKLVRAMVRSLAVAACRRCALANKLAVTDAIQPVGQKGLDERPSDTLIGS